MSSQETSRPQQQQQHQQQPTSAPTAEQLVESSSIEVPAPAAVPAEKAATEAPSVTPAQSHQQQQPVTTTTTTTITTTTTAPQNASLYVGELDPSVSEAMLFEIFNMVGPVASIRVCRDAVTRRSLGYAYVNFLSPADGERALDQLNYSLIKNKACRIMWSQRDPALRKTGSGNIFIKNLDEAIDNKALHDTFAAFGNVLSCKVATDSEGNSKGYGYVHYETMEAANMAIQHVDGMLLNDKKVFVGLHISNKERQSKIDEAKSQYTNIYVKNVDPELSQADFTKMFEEFGAVTSSVLSMADDGKTSKGFGFVNFDNHEHAEAAVTALNGKDINGKILFVGRAQKKAERQEELLKSHEAAQRERMNKFAGVNLYVKNLDDDFTDEKLRAEFEPFGTTTSVKIMRDDKGVSKGFGFVCFTSPDEATKAVSELSGKMLGSKPLYVSLAQRKDTRRQQLEGQIAQRTQMRVQQQMQAGMPMGAYGMQPMYYPGQAPGAYSSQQAMRGVPYPGQQQQGYPASRPRGYMPGQQGQQPPMMPVPNGYPGVQPGYSQGVYRQGGPGQRQPSVGQQMPRGPAPGPNMPRSGGHALNGQRVPTHNQSNMPPRNGPSSGRNPVRQAEEGLTASALANQSPEEQKQTLGEHIYKKVFLTQPDLAGKITGMLLELDNSTVLELLEDDTGFNVKVAEALKILKEHSASASTDQTSGAKAA